MKFTTIFLLATSLFFITVSASAQTTCLDYLKAKNFSKAIEACSADIESNGDSATAFRYRGLAYIYTDSYFKAESDLKKCVELDPLDLECHYWLGYINGSLDSQSKDSSASANKNPDEYLFSDNYYDDPFSWRLPEPSTTDEMKFAYREALAANDGYSLLRLAKIENEKSLLPNVKAGDILDNAYQIGLKYKYPNLLLNIAKYENSENLMSAKAGDILWQAYQIALFRRDARTIFSIAVYENSQNLLTAKAGDILYTAYTTARENRDVRILLRIADFEEEANLMPRLSAEQIRKEAMFINQR
ncbi:MAG: hypothetical protein K1X72_08600 [Pyrinomonadaceae bacterium]|nr:hypothetical protein [Pyrinomonadaceae bacterium]